jgi:GMP synthase (glutamine-hydrolysing)
MTDNRRGGIAILDYGSQYTQLIARRIREQYVYAALYPWDADEHDILDLDPRGIVLSGGPNSVYDDGAPTLPNWVLHSGLPVLGVCYGMQLLTHVLGGEVSPADEREYGHATFHHFEYFEPKLFADLPQDLEVWMSHGDRIDKAPAGFISLGESEHSPLAAIGHTNLQLYGVQFHPEVTHTPRGTTILRNFVFRICNCEPRWTPESLIEQTISDIREQVGDGRVILGLSGGVDSMVAARLLNEAIGDQLTAIFIDNGLMRHNEPENVVRIFHKHNQAELIPIDASDRFLKALSNVTEPERKRKVIGELFVRIFEETAAATGGAQFLAQGTIYPDVIESGGKERPNAHVIKTHHNVGGLPDDMTLELVEPLRYLFKDEVRRVGLELGLPESQVWRQPFPGPGLAIRCLGEVTAERLERLRKADYIFRQVLRQNELLRDTAQCYAALLPVNTVGVQGDQRTYAEAVALRAVVTDDFMTAEWARLPYEVLAEASSKIVNQVSGVNRVVYDITTKPPATIEWE